MCEMLVLFRFGEMIISRRIEKGGCLVEDTGWGDVAGLVSRCMESMSVLCTEGPPLRMQGGMSSLGYSELSWRFGVHEEDDMHEDSGAESESNGGVVGADGSGRSSFAVDIDECPSSEEDHLVSVSVGVPRRFGHASVLCVSDEETVATPESTVRMSLREILRKVKVKEAVLRSAIETLGGGVKGLQAVVEYVKHFQEANAGGGSPEIFTRGLERLCSLHGQAKPGSQKQSVIQLDHSSGGASRQTVLNLHNRTPDEHAADLCTVGYMEKMSGYVPNSGYPGNVQHPGELCSPHGAAGHNHPGALSSTNDSEMQQPGIRPTVPNMPNGQAGGDPYASMGYMENMSGYFPGFCYPYPPSFAGYGPFNMGVRPMYMPMMQVPYFTPPSFDYVHKTDAVTKASRKSRISRRRGHATDPHHARLAAKTVPTVVSAALAPQSGNHHESNAAAQPKVVSSSTQTMQGLSTRDLMLILQKQLSPSGVSSLGRIVLPKKEAETHLPHLVASEGVLLTMTDFDTAQNWTFRYRFWSNNKSRMYLLETTRDFVKAHNLQEGDMLSLYRDAEGSYVVRGEKNGSNQVVGSANEISTEEDAPATDDDLPQKRQKT